MTAAMLRLPMSAVLLTSLFLGSDGFAVIPLTIVSAVVAYLTSIWLAKPPPATVTTTHEQRDPHPAASTPNARIGTDPDGRRS
jgi:hypothetical protein